MTRKVLELIRVSTDSQATSDRASIPAQRAVNRRTAAAYDLEIIRSIEIKDVSGAAVLLSPEMQELVRLIADTSIHGVVAREFSRLMRPENFSDYALLQAFADSDTILYLPEGPIDFTSKTGRLLGTIRAAIAGMERSEILERVWSAKEEKRRAGKFAQSRICLPFAVGYSEPTGFFYKPEAERVKEAVRLFLAGNTSYRDVAQIVGLNPFTLRSIMRNPILTGWLDNSRGKSLLYDTAADSFRSKDTVVHNFATFTQLASIEGSSLRAPDGEMDDLADAYALALVARSLGGDDVPAVGAGLVEEASQWNIT
jgi:DNA invertase Pin-like site-specific DNA recombinase